MERMHGSRVGPPWISKFASSEVAILFYVVSVAKQVGTSLTWENPEDSFLGTKNRSEQQEIFWSKTQATRMRITFIYNK